MSLSQNVKVMLDTCSNAIALNRSIDFSDFSVLGYDLDWFEETQTYLAEKVEQFSNGRHTVRHASSALFLNGGVMGTNLYLVRCPVGTSAGIVTELTDDMLLLSLGPYEDGIEWPAAERTQR